MIPAAANDNTLAPAPAVRVPQMQAAYTAYYAPRDLRAQVLLLTRAAPRTLGRCPNRPRPLALTLPALRA